MTNPFLEGNFAPISQEHTLTELEVTGTIPDFLDGRYLRNGPNPLSEVDPAAYHWFMGDGMVHGVRMRDGKAEWYRNRWVRNPSIDAILDGDRPRRTPHGLSANTNVIGHAGKTLALMEAGATIWELSDELDTEGRCDFDGTLSGGYTAHPKRDPRTGELHAVSYSMAKGNKVTYSVIDAAGRVRREVDVEVTGAPMMHDFSLTERHVVFYDLPVTFDAGMATAAIPSRVLRTTARLVLSAVIGRVRIPDPITARLATKIAANGGLPYHWNPKYPARVGVMPREGGNGDVRWFDVEPCYVFHPLNAYDDGDSVVLDVVRHPRIFDRELHGPDEGVPTLDRWTVDFSSGKVIEERLDDRGQEFPRVDERLVGLRHRYGYAPAVSSGATPSEALYKHDFSNGSSQVRSFGAGRSPAEFVFVPRAADAAEDDGVLAGFVHDAATERSELTLLDAGTLETVAAIHLPDRVPIGFHGNWVPS
ncbi:carotenoid oxygenase family protein [Amycolatopsis sp. NBC_00355]|uniref:carotenoid oxygenase family protein n=1 Tax=Amycolatopsis sp. NBC_00355 TaxID=2975957 RepID=UPI002E2684B3